MNDGFERLDQVGFRGRFTSGLLAVFSVLVDEFHEDRLVRLGRQASCLLQRHRLCGIDAYRERQNWNRGKISHGFVLGGMEFDYRY